MLYDGRLQLRSSITITITITIAITITVARSLGRSSCGHSAVGAVAEVLIYRTGREKPSTGIQDRRSQVLIYKDRRSQVLIYRTGRWAGSGGDEDVQDVQDGGK